MGLVERKQVSKGRREREKSESPRAARKRETKIVKHYKVVVFFWNE